ncbi:MAG: flagellar protein FlaG [Bradyrhizobium sp.]|uniref:flagellar protein FlaG n=1 Tax=Bradyrhizobium sp. TaxID=376 RepID=UPI0025C37F49|nr:flagellar protein FlaG [Bradyrhizobium sp.]MBI5264102.1 flagellar protein FlaG [Bradyrhizobium sp.]
MSTDFSIRPVGTPALTTVVPSSPAASDSVPTELPPAQSVNAPDSGAGVRNDMHQSREDVSRQFIFDHAAASFVFQVVNDKTDEVVTQFPEEAVLRVRAYFHALDLSKSEAAHPLSTDVSA